MFMILICPPPPEFWKRIGAGFSLIGSKIGKLLMPMRRRIRSFIDAHPKLVDRALYIFAVSGFISMFVIMTVLIHAAVAGDI